MFHICPGFNFFHYYAHVCISFGFLAKSWVLDLDNLGFEGS